MTTLPTLAKTYIDYPTIRMTTDAADASILVNSVASLVVKIVNGDGMLIYEKESEDKIRVNAIPDGMALTGVATLCVAEVPLSPTVIVDPVTEPITPIDLQDSSSSGYSGDSGSSGHSGDLSDSGYSGFNNSGYSGYSGDSSDLDN